jgi:hypothetical protein
MKIARPYPWVPNVKTLAADIDQTINHSLF